MIIAPACQTAARRAFAGRVLFLPALILALFLAGCAPGPRVTARGQESQNLWSAFAAQSSSSPAPSRVDGSLRFGPRNDTRRVTYILWNNGDLPLRLDVQAGAGMTAASIEVSGDTVLTYMPRDEKAYIGTDSPDKALRGLGLPMPMSVAQLNSLIQGRYLEALGDPVVLGSSPAVDSPNTVFQIEGAHGKSSLELSPQARPARWSLPGSWTVDFSHEDESGLPTRIEALLPAGAPGSKGQDYRVIVLVKKRRPRPPFPPSDLRLDVPPGTPVYNLDT